MKKEFKYHKIYINWLSILFIILADVFAFHLHKTQWGNHPYTITGLVVLNSIFVLVILGSICSIYIDLNYLIINLDYEKKNSSFRHI